MYILLLFLQLFTYSFLLPPPPHSSSSRRKRAVPVSDEADIYANFVQPHVIVLPSYTSELRPLESSNANTPTISLQVQFYVELPVHACRSVNRSTNYVVPRATLNHIVSQDNSTIGAVVRNTVSPPLTLIPLDIWRVVGLVCLVLIAVSMFSVVGIAVGYMMYKYKEV